jgi:N-acetylglucosaminyldiphosphoundecaprenol N-acetyl-beta-D-mannosaminyltransferase
MGLEWVFRLLQEPRRLARRYYVSNSIFIGLLVRSMIAGARKRSTVGS